MNVTVLVAVVILLFLLLLPLLVTVVVVVVPMRGLSLVLAMLLVAVAVSPAAIARARHGTTRCRKQVGKDLYRRGRRPRAPYSTQEKSKGKTKRERGQEMGDSRDAVAGSFFFNIKERALLRVIARCMLERPNRPFPLFL